MNHVHRLPHASVATRLRLRTVLVSLSCVFGAASMSFAHEWSELSIAYVTGEIEAAVSATEAVQAALEANEVPPLSGDAWTYDWWRWFILAAQLHERQGQEVLREALAAAGFPHGSDDAVAAWRDVLEHLVAVSDARRAAEVPTPPDAVFEADPAGANAADLVRSSYLASLQGTPTDGVPGPILVRLDALVDAARQP